MNTALILLRAALVCYAAGFAAAWIPMFREQRHEGRWAAWFAMAGLGCHTLSLLKQTLAQHRFPLGTGGEVLATCAWASVVLALGVGWKGRPGILYLIVLPFAIVVLLLSKILPGEVVPLAQSLKLTATILHVSVIVAAMAVLSLTFAAGVAYLYIDRALKAKRPSRWFRTLPSLEGCDRLGRRSLLLGFSVLTLGLMTGALVNRSLTGTLWTWQPKETLAILAWALLGVVVAARVGYGWRGRKAAILTLIGFGLVFLRLLGFGLG
jgi:ABC-type uncharacterized transport system permease subunit